MPHIAPAPLADPATALAAAGIARALDTILASLIDLLWTRSLYIRLLGALAGPVQARLARTRRRLALALAHLAAGHVPPPPRPRLTPCRSGARIPFPNRHFGWLGHLLDHHVRATASQLAHLLHEPGVAALIATSPGAARTLRPLARMLGVPLPEPLRLPPLPPRAPKPRSAKPPAAAPPLDRPLQPYVRAAARAWKRRDEKIA